jgi:RimJ/RimL family protein N-acetyltransferase
MPFLVPWHEEPEDIRPLHSARFYWQQRASFLPEEWHLMFVVRRDDEVLGVQDLFTTSDFRQTRSLETASWLALPYHHQGVGTLMRQMVASFAFDQLGATELTSCYLDGNLASAAVSRKLGYQPNGVRRAARQDGWVLEHHVRLEPQDFLRPAEPVRYRGVAEFRAFVGLD